MKKKSEHSYTPPRSQIARDAFNNDRRWADVKVEINRCQFEKAGKIVLEIMRDHDYI